MLNPFDKMLIDAQAQHDAAMAEGRAFATIDLDTVRDEMTTAWKAAADAYFRDVLKGADTGTAGFAWVAVKPAHPGNTKAGKAERKALTEMHFERLSSGEYGFDVIWTAAQNMGCHQAGAEAAAEVIKRYGFNADTDILVD